MHWPGNTFLSVAVDETSSLPLTCVIFTGVVNIWLLGVISICHLMHLSYIQWTV